MERPDTGWLKATCVLVLLLCGTTQAADKRDTLEPVRTAIRLKQFSQAATLLQTSASHGDAQAQYLLGTLYRSGLGVTEDAKLAREWITQAAEQGHADAAYALAAMLASDAAPRSEIDHWLQVAARAGHALASQALTAGIQPQRFQPEKSLQDAQLRRAAFWLAARQDDTSQMELLDDPQLLNATDSFGRSALAQAARSGAGRATQWLLQAGVTSNQMDAAGITPLMLAAGSGHDAVVRLLLAAHASPNAQDAVGNTALMFAAANRHLDSALLLLDHCDLKLLNAQGWSALDWALKSESTELADALRARGLSTQRKATVTATTPSIPLQHAGRADLYQSWPDVLIAANRSKPDLFMNVLKVNADTAAIGPNGETALMVAVQSGNNAVVERLLGSGARVRSDVAETPLSWALRHHQAAMVQLLLSKGYKPDIHGMHEAPPLLDAVRQGDALSTQALLKAVAAVEIADEHGHTPLIMAAQLNRADVVTLLLDSGANIDAIDKAGHTALWHAAALAADDCVQRLLQGKADVDKHGANSGTPLMAAITGEHGATAELLINAGARVNSTHDGATVLMLAAAQGNDALVRHMLAAGANTDAQNLFGDTALMLAARSGHAAAVRTLVAAGASTQLRNSDRASALDIARYLGHKEVAAILDKQG